MSRVIIIKVNIGYFQWYDAMGLVPFLFGFFCLAWIVSDFYTMFIFTFLKKYILM